MPKVLEGIQIVRQQADVLPNFALVQVAGCLEPGPCESLGVDGRDRTRSLLGKVRFRLRT